MGHDFDLTNLTAVLRADWRRIRAITAFSPLAGLRQGKEAPSAPVWVCFEVLVGKV